MNHQEFESRLDVFSDSDEDVRAVLEHAEGCAVCRRDTRRADRALRDLEEGSSISERIVRWGTAAAAVLLLVVGLAGHFGNTARPVKSAARYRIVGDASGVVAYTPSGVVMGFPAASSKEVSR
jgi:hypothetical protein